MLRSITSSSRITFRCTSPGMGTIRDSTLGTCTVANSISKMYGLDGFDHLKEQRYLKPQPVPELAEETDVFSKIREGDILMHHPYQTFLFIKTCLQFHQNGYLLPVVRRLFQSRNDG